MGIELPMLLPIAAAAKRLNVSARDVADALRKNLVSSHHADGYRRIDETDLPKLKRVVQPKPKPWLPDFFYPPQDETVSTR